MSLDHRLSAELEELRRTVEAFAHDVVAPKIGEYYEQHAFPYEIVREMGRMGLFGLPFPEEYGGMGGDYLALGIALEELARVDSSVAITLEAGVSLGAMPSTASARRSRSASGCPSCAAVRCWAPSASPSRTAARTPARPAPPPYATATAG